MQVALERIRIAAINGLIADLCGAIPPGASDLRLRAYRECCGGIVPEAKPLDQRWRIAAISNIRGFEHVGITVDDLDSVTAFFVGLGLEVEGRTFVEGEFLDTVIGIPDSRTEIVMLRPPDGGFGIELASFVRPDHEPGSPAAMANELGLRSVCFEVADLQAAVDGWLRTDTDWSAASASTRTPGAWPTSAGPKESLSR